MRMRNGGAGHADTLQVARTSALLVFGQAIGTALGFLKTIIAAKVLGADGYGMAVVLMAYPDLVWSAVQLKSADVTVAYISRFRQERRHDMLLAAAATGFFFDLLLAVAALLIVALTASWISAKTLSGPNAAQPMILYAASFPAASLLTPSFAIFTAYDRFKFLSLLQALSSALQTLFVCILLWAKFGGPALALGTGAAQALTGILGVLGAASVMGRDPQFAWNRARLGLLLPLARQMSKPFGWNFAVITLRGPIEQLPALVLSSVSGTAAAGYYRLATSIAAVARYAETALARTVYPGLSCVSKNPAPEVRQIVRRWSWRLGVPCAALLLLGFALVPVLLPRIFGSQYRPMISGLLFMLGATAFSVTVFWVRPLYYSYGRIDLWAKGYAVYSAAMVVALFAVVRIGGFTGVAIAQSFTYTAFIAVMTICCRRAKWLSFGSTLVPAEADPVLATDANAL